MSPKGKPEEPVEAEIVDEKNNNKKEEKAKKTGGRFTLGLILICLGALFIIGNLFPELNIWQNFWPIMLIVIGLSLIARSIRE